MDQDEEAGKTFIIRPPFPLKIGTLEQDKNEIKRVYQVGREEGKKILPALKDYLDN